VLDLERAWAREAMDFNLLCPFESVLSPLDPSSPISREEEEEVGEEEEEVGEAE
jgi:hypothetical protein